MSTELEIARLLSESPLSMSEISRRARLSRASLYDVRRGKFRLKPDSLQRLLHALGLPPEQITFLIEETICERLQARKTRPGCNLADRESVVFLDGLLQKLVELGCNYSNNDPYADFCVRDGDRSIPVIAKISIAQPERFFAPAMAAKLNHDSEWAAIVTPFPPSSHKYEKLFLHHGILWLDVGGFLKKFGL